jgi:hypothetical protein
LQQIEVMTDPPGRLEDHQSPGQGTGRYRVAIRASQPRFGNGDRQDIAQIILTGKGQLAGFTLPRALLQPGWEVADIEQPEYARLATEWFDAMLTKTAAEVDDLFGKYRLSEALMAVYKLFWDEFSSWYLEMVKPAYGQPIDKATYEKTLGFFDTLLKLLHPFMPFITEELWQHIYDRKEGESIMTQILNVAGKS